MEENRLQRTSNNDPQKRKQQFRQTDGSFAKELSSVLDALDISGHESLFASELGFEENDIQHKKRRNFRLFLCYNHDFYYFSSTTSKSASSTSSSVDFELESEVLPALVLDSASSC